MGIETIALLVALGAVFYFLMIRPQKKQQQKQREMMAALGVGTRVMLGSGIYGTIRHLGEKQAIIEISPGVDMTVLRIAIRGAVGPDEEEFEYATEIDAPEEENVENMEAFEADLAAAFAPPESEAEDDDPSEASTEAEEK